MAQPEDTVTTNGSPALTNKALKELDDRLDQLDPNAESVEDPPGSGLFRN